MYSQETEREIRLPSIKNRSKYIEHETRHLRSAKKNWLQNVPWCRNLKRYDDKNASLGHLNYFNPITLQQDEAQIEQAQAAILLKQTYIETK